MRIKFVDGFEVIVRECQKHKVEWSEYEMGCHKCIDEEERAEQVQAMVDAENALPPIDLGCNCGRCDDCIY